ncbi:MAG: hypothetical protein HOP14_13860 [Acidobacteria bacterium]|nr:hypothetical protein [Acidobacteriota bacterium]
MTPVEFGAWLTRERERRQMTIATVAHRTKITGALLEGLERGDLTRWPTGIYRRAFMRAYASAVGLDVDYAMRHFSHLFDEESPARRPEREVARPAEPLETPEPSVTAGVTPPASGEEAEPALRLQLGEQPRVAVASTQLSMLLMPLGFPLALGVLGFFAAGAIGFWCVTALAALAWGVNDAFSKRQGVQPAALAPELGTSAVSAAELPLHLPEPDALPVRRTRAVSTPRPSRRQEPATPPSHVPSLRRRTTDRADEIRPEA